MTLIQSLHQIINKEDSCKNDTDVTNKVRKLENLKKQLGEDTKVDIEAKALEMGNAVQSPILESIQKVQDWQNSLPPPENIPNYYSSLPTSPTPPVPLINPNQNVSFEVDSGCPGSELWSSNIQSQRVTSNSRSISRENLGTPLYEVEEENIRYIGKAEKTNESSTKPEHILSLNTEFVSNISIEQGVKLSARAESEVRKAGSNQYRNIFKDQRELYKKQLPVNMTSTPIKQNTDLQRERPSNSVPSSPHARNLTRTRITPKISREWESKGLVEPKLNYRNKQSSNCLFPEQIDKGAHSQTLSKQIDDEILELRNFFEDHREEMISLLHGPGEDVGNHRSLPADCHNRSLPVLQQDNNQICYRASPIETYPLTKKI